jgi:plastocyanin
MLNRLFSLRCLGMPMAGLVILAGSAVAHDPGEMASSTRDAAPAVAIQDASYSVRPRPSGVVATRIWNVAVGPSLSFSPNTLLILAGDTVKWTWAASGHTVTSGTPCTVDSQYCSPSDLSCTTAATSPSNATYSHVYPATGTFPYFCRIHCSSGMTGSVKVILPTIVTVTRAANGHFILDGISAPNITGTVQSTSSLTTSFVNPQSITTDATGAFHYDDGSVVNGTQQFYQVSF